MINLILDPHARELATKLDGLPLALATAGAYLSQVSASLADYLRYYNSSWLRLQETSPELSSYEDRALYSTWNISYKHIRSRNESAGKLLQLWAYFDNQDLWYALLAGGSKCSPEWFSTIIDDELNFNEAIRLLCDHALVESHGVSGGYGMHNCVHAWIMHVLNSERDIPMAKLALICVCSAIPDKTVLEYWALQRRLLPHANRYLKLVYNASIFDLENDQILNAAFNLGFLYSDQGKMKEAEEMYLRALTGFEKAWGPEHTSTLDTVNNLGALYSDQDKMKEAEEMYLRALTGKEKARGSEHTSTLDTVNNLANLYSIQGKMKEAEEMYLRALTGYEKAWGSEHTSTLETVNNLGLLYSDQGKMKEAEEMYLRALAGYEKAWGSEHISTLDTIYNLAIMYMKRLMFEDAAKHFELVVQGYTKILGPEHSETVEALDLWKSCKGK